MENQCSVIIIVLQGMNSAVQIEDIITNRWFIGFTIKGTLGAELYEEIDVVSDNIFEKYFSDAFTSKPFLVHVKKKGYSEVVLCGLDEYGCVGATAKGAVRFGMTTYILKDSVGSRFSKRKIEKIRQPYIDGEKEISEINAEYRAPFVR